MIDAAARQYAAELGRRHFEGTVTLRALFEHFGSSDDPLIRALLEAAAYQPSRGFAGVSQKRWEQEFWGPVSKLLIELEKGAEGRAPTRRVYPRSGFAGVIGWSSFSVFAAASVLEHAVNLWGVLRGTTSLPAWEATLKFLGLAVTAAATYAGIRMVIFRLRLYRTRDNPYGNGDGQAGP